MKGSYLNFIEYLFRKRYHNREKNTQFITQIKNQMGFVITKLFKIMNLYYNEVPFS